ASGLLWKSGCGDRFEEAFLAGTEPEEPCRRRIDRAPIFVEFEEPPVITPEQSQEWSIETPGLGDVQIILDPAASLPDPRGDDDPDELDEEEREATDRQLEEAMREAARRRPEVQLPPIPPPELSRRDDDDDEDDDDEDDDDEDRGRGKARGKSKNPD
ncbi:MAG TPA: hypothetical protein VM779_06240, partial [Thermoanaerobaculia bacterium]|nr:hypothetical protein [Thermoanaerobaculia bacterium]